MEEILDTSVHHVEGTGEMAEYRDELKRHPDKEIVVPAFTLKGKNIIQESIILAKSEQFVT